MFKKEVLFKTYHSMSVNQIKAKLIETNKSLNLAQKEIDALEIIIYKNRDFLKRYFVCLNKKIKLTESVKRFEKAKFFPPLIKEEKKKLQQSEKMLNALAKQNPQAIKAYNKRHELITLVNQEKENQELLTSIYNKKLALQSKEM